MEVEEAEEQKAGVVKIEGVWASVEEDDVLVVASCESSQQCERATVKGVAKEAENL